jgi:ribosomal protein L14
MDRSAVKFKITESIIFYQSGQRIDSSDNSKVLFADILKHLKKHSNIVAFTATVIKKVLPHKKLRLGQFHKVSIFRHKWVTFLLSGKWYRCAQPHFMLLKKETSKTHKVLKRSDVPYSTRLYGPVPLRLRKRKYIKMFSAATVFL